LVGATDPLVGLRARTAILHRQLESATAFSRLMQDDIGPDDIARALILFHVFYDGLEQVLLPRLENSSHASLYRPRRALLAGDLARLGHLPPAAMSVDLPETEAGLLGVIYAVEGSALGGQVLARHLMARLGGEFAAKLTYFTDLAAGCGAHWQGVLSALRLVLVDEDSLDEVSAGASLVFSSLIHLADRERPDGLG
jgi:heme oxygenase